MSRRSDHDHRDRGATSSADIARWRGSVVVTGTDTGVGKTIVTAAIAAAAGAAGLRVAVLKPAQTGGDNDAATVARLAAPATTRTLAFYPDPLAPLTAARVAGLPPLPLERAAAATRELTDEHDLVLIEGAGGLLVGLGASPEGGAWTIADLARAVAAPAVVVVRAGLGTLSHTALTMEALARRHVPAVIVIGAWPAEPALVHRANLADLAAIGNLVGAVPDGAGALDPSGFRIQAQRWLTPAPTTDTA